MAIRQLDPTERLAALKRRQRKLWTEISRGNAGRSYQEAHRLRRDEQRLAEEIKKLEARVR